MDIITDFGISLMSDSDLKPSDWETWQLCLWLPGGTWWKLWKQSPAGPILWLRQARWHQNQLQPAVDEICFRWLCQQGRLCCQLLQRLEVEGCKLITDVFQELTCLPCSSKYYSCIRFFFFTPPLSSLLPPLNGTAVVLEGFSCKPQSQGASKKGPNISLCFQRWMSAPSRTTVAVSNAVSTH